MPAESPLQLDALLVDVLARPSGERAAFMDEVCGEDTRLRFELEGLLQLHAQAGDFLESPAVALPERPDFAGANDGIGSIIGRYKLLEHIGEGGFGSVFMAEQEQPVRRKVALKVIKLGMDTRQVVARFEAERQALAMMDHPNIARVLDGGATESGRPYFVMELVRGTPITAFCDEHRLTVRERLDLFVQVCHAVQHAHTKGVIHRDLKPSNILAVRHDGTPTVKVIDFGIVKAIGVGDQLTDKTLFTEFRQLIGTPAYMSPEQAGMSDIDVDTRSDIYSLGVLLYELLTGATPFDAKSLLESGHDEMRRIIREVEPPKPSQRISRSSSAASMPSNDNFDKGSSAHIVARFRHTEPSALARMLLGDLDWIVMKCLDKDRTRRYETAHDLAGDIERYLRDEPVTAGPPSRTYRLRKLIRRNRGAFAAAGLVCAAIVAGLSLAMYGFVQANREQKRAESFGGFLKEVLTLADPTRAKGEKLTVREAMDRAAKRIDEGSLRDQPLVEAELRTTIGETYNSLSLYPKAEAQLRAAEVIFVRELGNEHADTLRTRICLAETLSWSSQYAAAVAVAEPTVEACRRVLGPEHADTLRAILILGSTLPEVGRFPEGESLLLAAVEARRRVLGPDHPDTADALNSLGGIYIYHNKPAKAEPLFRESWRIHSATLGEEDLRTLDSHAWLGSALYNQHRAVEAEAIFRKSAEIHKRLLGPEHTRTLGRTGDLGAALARQGKHAEAEPLLRESFEACLRHHGRLYLGTISGRRFLASCVNAQGRSEEAELLLRESLKDAREAFGPEHGDTTIRLMCALADVLAEQHKDVEAEVVGREVLAIQLRMVPRADQAQVTQCARALHTALRRQGKTEDALRVSREMLHFLVTATNESDAGASALNRTARFLLTIEEHELRDSAKALELARKAVDKSEFKNPDYLDTLALAHHRTGDTGKSIEFQKKAISLLPADSRALAQFEDRLREYEATSRSEVEKREN